MAKENVEPKHKERVLDRVTDEDEDEVPIGEEREPDDDGEEPDAAAAKSPEEVSRDQKKRDRFRENKQAARESAQRAKDAEDRAVRAEARAAATETTYRMEMDRQRREATPKDDPLEKEDERLAAEQQGVLDQWEALQSANKLTPEVSKRLREQASSLQKQRIRIAAKQEMAAMAPAQNAVTSENVGRHMTASYIQTNYGDIVGDPVALAYANARHLELVRREGKPDTQQTLDEVMAETRTKYFGSNGGARASSQPSAATRRGATSTSTGGGGGIGSGSGRRGYTPSKDERRIAKAMYPTLDEKAAVHKWVNTVKPFED